MGGQYLFETGVGGITHKLQNEPFTGGEEGPALPHPGQCHQPVHLAAVGERVSVPRLGHPDTGKLGRDLVPWFFLGTPPIPHMHPSLGRTLLPAGGAGIHHHVDLQPPVQEVQGCVLGAERGQGQPQTRTEVPGEGLGSQDVDEGGSDQGRTPQWGGAPGKERGPER